MENPYTTTKEYNSKFSKETKRAMDFFYQRYDTDMCIITNTAHLKFALAKVERLIKSEINSSEEYIEEHVKPVYNQHLLTITQELNIES